jgi:hypothetical protein
LKAATHNPGAESAPCGFPGMLTKDIYLIPFVAIALMSSVFKMRKYKFSDYVFCFDEEKNKKLKFERGIGFEEVIDILQNSLELDIIGHHNKTKYLNQRIFVVRKGNYVYAVPFVENSDKQIFLKTIFPNRKLQKKYVAIAKYKEVKKL